MDNTTGFAFGGDAGLRKEEWLFKLIGGVKTALFSWFRDLLAPWKREFVLTSNSQPDGRGLRPFTNEAWATVTFFWRVEKLE